MTNLLFYLEMEQPKDVAFELIVCQLFIFQG